MSYAAFGTKNIRRFFLTFWAATFILLQFILQYFFHISAATAFTDNFISIALIIVFLVIANTKDYVVRAEGYQLIPVFVVLAVLSAACVAITGGLLYFLNIANKAYISFLIASLPYRFVYVWFFICEFTFMNYLWHRASEKGTMQQRDDDLHKLAKEAELNKIYQQMQPHFLFNSLNSINTLINSKPQQAKEMVQNLSDFLRGSLKKIDEDKIPLEEEMKHLTLYLKLEEVRFGDRLETKIKVTENAQKSFLPPLIIQPLLENAIKYGLYGTLGKVSIHFKAAKYGKDLFIMITNPFDKDAQPPKGTGFGLKAVKRRLYLTFGRNDLLETRQIKQTFVTRLQIPQNYDNEHNN